MPAVYTFYPPAPVVCLRDQVITGAMGERRTIGVRLKIVDCGRTGLRRRSPGTPPRWTGADRSRSGASQPGADRGRVWVAVTLLLAPF